MTDEEKYAPDKVLVDRIRTERAIAAWNYEARRRAKEDIYIKLTGSTFVGLERDPNAAFIVGVMQKLFVSLAKDPAAQIVRFPGFRKDQPKIMGIVTVAEDALGEAGREALLILRRISDDVSEREFEDEEGRTRRRIRFTLTEVWATYDHRGKSYREWLWLTYGDEKDTSQSSPFVP